MDWMTLLSKLFEIVIFPLLGACTVYLCYLIKVKATELKQKTKNEKEAKYLDMLSTTITNAVIATNQTYVEALKKEGKFDTEAQKIAFEKTYETVMKLLSEEAIEYLTTIIGDLQADIQNKIEAEVNIVKNM